MSLLTFPNQQKASEDARLALNPALILRFRNNFAEDFGRRTARNHGTYNGGVTPNVRGPLARAVNGGGAARFDGSTGYDSIPINLSAYNKITVELWLWWDTFANTDVVALEYTPNQNLNTGSFFFSPNGSVGNKINVVMFASTGNYNSVEFARPSAAAWHHYAFVLDRTAAAGTQIIPYLDGQAVSFSKTLTSAVSGNFANSTLYGMSRAGSSLFGAGRMSALAIYPTALTVNQIGMLYEIDTGKWIPGKRVYSFASGGLLLRRRREAA
jgi:hypothetical protein